MANKDTTSSLLLDLILKNINSFDLKFLITLIKQALYFGDFEIGQLLITKVRDINPSEVIDCYLNYLENLAAYDLHMAIALQPTATNGNIQENLMRRYLELQHIIQQHRQEKINDLQLT